MNKQIEEMAKEIESAKRDIWASVKTRKEDEDYLWHSRIIAEHLTSLGYQKVDKDSVVLTRKEWKNLHEEKNDYKQRFESSEKRYEQLVQSSCEALEKKSKETAENILNELYVQFSADYLVGLRNKYKDWKYADLIKRYAKQFGVEIKE